MKKFKILLVTTTLLAMSGVANADSLPSRGAVAQIVTGVNDTYTLTGGTSGSSSGSGASASVDLATGQLRVVTQGTTMPSANAIGFEFLTFSSNATVSYGFDVSGTLNNLNPNGAVRVEGIINLYDVTGLGPNYFTTIPDFPGYEFIYSVPIAGSSGKATVIYGDGFSPTEVFGDPLPAYMDFIPSQDGSAVPVAMNITGSFNVQADHLYALALALSTGEFGSAGFQQGADFSNTAAFTFTDLGGAEVTSSSGLFLSNVPPPVSTPEPMTLTLLGVGLAAMVEVVRKRRSA